ncbi:hypothetical protein [Mycobacterium sp. NPDC050041]|uniref:hypothetical protein n=1 Tax=Mycobacterium sp. NPDC050041 TaxID=3364293 RepID=UPI003C2FA0D3
MISNTNAFVGVGVAGMSRTLHVVAGTSAVAVYHASAAAAAAIAAWPAAAIPAPRKRRAATATRPSVIRGTT